MPLVEFDRLIERRQETGEGEDDGISGPIVARIAINPLYVSAVLGSLSAPDASIVRGPDGRGMMVKGGFDEVTAKLRGSTGPDLVAQ